MVDLLKIANSKTREKILVFFYANAGKKYYLRELERILSLSVGNIRRELISLERIGLFKKERMGNQLYYYLNQASPLFEAVQSIIVASGTIDSKKILRSIKKDKTAREESVFIKKEDLDSLVYRISELENILASITKDMPKKSLNRKVEFKAKTKEAEKEFIKVKR